MKKSAVYVVLLLVVVIAVCVLCIRVMTKDKAQPEKPAPTQAVYTLPPTEEPELTLPPVTPEEPEPSAEPTEEPTETPVETETPMETRPPVETEPPATPKPLDADGSFRSDTGTHLNLVADWAADAAGDNVTLQVVLYAESYSFYTSALYNSLQLTVNGMVYSANSPDVRYDGADLARTQLASFTVTVPRGQTSVEAVWHYKGSYSGVELNDIYASTTLDLN